MFRPHHRMYLAAFLLDFGIMAGMTALPFFVFNQLGGGAAMSGYLSGVQSAAYAITCLLASGWLTQVKNGLHWALFGMGVFAFSFLFMPFIRTPFLCGAVVFVAFTGLALVWPALHSWIGSEPDPIARTGHISSFNLAWSFGFSVSPFFVGPLCDWDYRLPFVLLVVLCLGVIALIRSLPHERDYFGVASAAALEERAEHDRASEAHLYYAWCATLIANGLVAATRSVYPKRIDDLVASGQLRLFFEQSPAPFLGSAPATKFSWLAGGTALAMATFFVILGRTHRWRHRFGMLLACQILSAAACYVLADTRSLAVMMVSFVILGANLGIAFFSSAYYSLANPDYKHRRASINEGAVGVGGLLGSVGFGYLAGQYGLTFPFHAAPWFIAGGLIAQMTLFRYGKNQRRRL